MAIELRDARDLATDREWLANVYPFYLHDLSEFFDDCYELDEWGRWTPDYLPSWLEDGPDEPLILLDGGERVGLALVNRAPSRHLSPGFDFKMAEFFVLRRHRRHGIGQRAVRAIFERCPGRWEITELPRNATAIAFWRRVIGEYSGGAHEETSDAHAVRQVLDTRRRQAPIRRPS